MICVSSCYLVEEDKYLLLSTLELDQSQKNNELPSNTNTSVPPTPHLIKKTNFNGKLLHRDFIHKRSFFCLQNKLNLK